MDRRQNKQGRKKFPAIALRDAAEKWEREFSSNTFCLALRHRLSLSLVPLLLFLSSSTSRPSSRIAREYFRRIFRDAVSLVPRRKSLNAIKVFLEKILREVSSRSSKVNLLSETFNMEASRLRYISLDLLRSPYRLEILTRTIHVYICIVMVSIRIWVRWTISSRDHPQ